MIKSMLIEMKKVRKVRTEELDYKLPKELIAQKPIFPRDEAKLMILNRKTKLIEHSQFNKIDKFFKKGDVLVFNKSKVFSARIFGKSGTGKKVEIVFLEETKDREWEIIIGGKIKNGETIEFTADLVGEVVRNKFIKLKINKKKDDLYKYLDKHGKMPLPPYIKREANKKDRDDYQTIYAEKIGSAAAPTAGLHFTEGLVKKLKNKGVQIEYVTLHVGLGTFAPIRSNKVEDHNIHSEYFELDKTTSARLNKAKKENRRIVACGTTTVRVLESCVKKGEVKPRNGVTKLFIYPGYKYKFVDRIITNFHTPKSSLLALIYAFYGEEETKKAYKEAIKNKYRFFSYGDGILIL